MEGDLMVLGFTTESEARSASIEVAKGIQKSRDLIASLMTRTELVSFGFARIERFPRARAPNSSRPQWRATTCPAASSSAIDRSIFGSFENFTWALNRYALSACSTSLFEYCGPK